MRVMGSTKHGRNGNPRGRGGARRQLVSSMPPGSDSSTRKIEQGSGDLKDAEEESHPPFTVGLTSRQPSVEASLKDGDSSKLSSPSSAFPRTEPGDTSANGQCGILAYRPSSRGRREQCHMLSSGSPPSPTIPLSCQCPASWVGDTAAAPGWSGTDKSFHPSRVDSAEIHDEMFKLSTESHTDSSISSRKRRNVSINNMRRKVKIVSPVKDEKDVSLAHNHNSGVIGVYTEMGEDTLEINDDSSSLI